MRKRILFLFLILSALGGVVVFAFRDRLVARPAGRVLSVPDGDIEIAWFNTTTAYAAWERFVIGINRAARANSDLSIDDSRAFLEQTTGIPEVVISWKNRPGKMRIRWYKQTSEMNSRQWIDALAERNPPPLAIIGGGSSDRARDLASDLNARRQWRGPRPLFLITTATANEVGEGSERAKLTQIYPERSFRFCFTNEQMARAVVDFVWHKPELRPSGAPSKQKNDDPPVIFPVEWKDDPYSIDLSEKFRQAVKTKTAGRFEQPFISHPPYSVGLFDRANRAEAEYAMYILAEAPTLPSQRSLLILPTSTAPARRFLRALTGESPLIGRNLVAINGDAISINDVYRDGALLWNMRDLSIPLVFFAHQNPIDWDDQLRAPAGTDDVLLYTELMRVVLAAVRPDDGDLVRDADRLQRNIRSQTLISFDEDGNRREGSEYVVYLKPDIGEMGRINPRADLEVWTRTLGGDWKRVKETQPLQAPYPSRKARRLAGDPP
ncbi:MAG: hypothetical protein K8T89_10105 [Planctomycetes bacterium]|nr:hypothetical protein [Planctomycetota bacterium]